VLKCIELHKNAYVYFCTLPVATRSRERQLRHQLTALLWKLLIRDTCKTPTENIHESTTQQLRLHQWVWRLNHHLETVHTVSTYMARFTNVSLLYPLMANMSEYGQRYIFDSLKATTNFSKTNQTKGVWQT
jgi:hypothetical protein